MHARAPASPAPRAAPHRGVQKVYDDCNRGTIYYKLTLSTGDVIAVKMLEELADARMDEIAELFLDLKDPLMRPPLALID